MIRYSFQSIYPNLSAVLMNNGKTAVVILAINTISRITSLFLPLPSSRSSIPPPLSFSLTLVTQPAASSRRFSINYRPTSLKVLVAKLPPHSWRNAGALNYDVKLARSTSRGCAASRPRVTRSEQRDAPSRRAELDVFGKV